MAIAGVQRGRNPYRDAVGKFASKQANSMRSNLANSLRGSPELLAKAKGLVAKGASKAVEFAKNNKETILTEGSVVAAGFIGSKVAGTASGVAAGAAMRVAIGIGKKAFKRVNEAKAEAVTSNGKGLMGLVKKAGLGFISDLKSGKFQRSLEKGAIGDLSYALVANTVNALQPYPIGDMVALKTSGYVSKLASAGVQKVKKQIKARRSGGK